jgi:hypothetical protein
MGLKVKDPNGEWRSTGGGGGGSGKDGFSPVVAVDPVEGGNRVTITDAKGNKTFVVKDGQEGAPGKTPIKGEDYFTEEDKREVAEGVTALASCKPIVQTYGAKGDGKTDDTDAFRLALAENRVLYVPGGEYLLSETLRIGDNCELELAQDAVLRFTQTEGNCIQMEMSASLRGNHATVIVPYAFNGNVLYVSSTTTEDQAAVPPFTRWDPMWKSGRYVTDLNIVKPDSRGFCYSVDGDCYGTAVYISADGSATSTYVWGLHFSGIRIAGGFHYGIHAVNLNEGWAHEMWVDAFIDACEVGVCLDHCSCAYISAIVQPRRAYSMAGVYAPYAKHGIQLINSTNVDLSGSRVWDWNASNALWTVGGVYQHLALYGNCRGLILNDFLYYETSYDIRDLIYTDTASNYQQMTILQEPFTRWFKPSDNLPFFYNGYVDKRLVLQEEVEEFFETNRVLGFTDVLSTAIDKDGTVMDGKGYKDGYYIGTNGETYVAAGDYICTGFIAVKPGDTIYAKNLSIDKGGNDNTRILLYDADFNFLVLVNRGNIMTGTSYYVGYEESDDEFKMPIKNPAATAYVRFNFSKKAMGDDPLIAVNEEIVYKREGFLADGIRVKGDNVVLYSPEGKSFLLSVGEDGTLSTTPV